MAQLSLISKILLQDPWLLNNIEWAITKKTKMATIANIPIDPSQVTKEWLRTVLKVSMTSVLSFENMGQLRVDVKVHIF